MYQTVTTACLSEMLRDARSHTLGLLDGLDAGQLIGPMRYIVNPMQWEIGHVTRFYEYIILRSLYGHKPLLANSPAGRDIFAGSGTCALNGDH